MTHQEQYIYNCYLETSRKLNNQSFRYRKDFTGFEEKEEYATVAKLAYFFNKFDNINVKDFFEAPYFVHNEKFFDLKYFISQKAIKAYTIYENKFLPDNPDHTQTILKIKDSFLYIYNFCKSKNIKMSDYISYKESNSQWHNFLMHVKSRNVIVYALFIFPNFDKVIKTYDNEIKEFTFGDTFTNLNFYRTKYYSSSKAKKLCTSIYEKLTSLQTTV